MTCLSRLISGPNDRENATDSEQTDRLPELHLLIPELKFLSFSLEFLSNAPMGYKWLGKCRHAVVCFQAGFACRLKSTYHLPETLHPSVPRCSCPALLTVNSMADFYCLLFIRRVLRKPFHTDDVCDAVYLFQGAAQGWPFDAVHFENQVVFGFFRRNLKGLKEGAFDGFEPEDRDLLLPFMHRQ